MDIITLDKDLHVFGKPVPDFPYGIQEAFDSLVNVLPGGINGRPYYGLSSMEDNKIMYHATALELSEGEAEKYNQTRYTIPKGNYLAFTITDWMKKLGSIGETFQEMMHDPRADLTKPCVEWYKNDDEMVCMLKVR